MDYPFPFPGDPYELRALLLSSMDDLTQPMEWRDACLASGRMSSWTFANSVLVSMQHRVERTLHPGMPDHPTLIASGAAWVRAGRYARPGVSGYRILKADETGGLTAGMVYDISQTDGTPYLSLAPSAPSITPVMDAMESMFGEFESDGEPLHVKRGQNDRDCMVDGHDVLLDASLDDASAVRAMARELSLIILSDHEQTPAMLEEFTARSASLMVCAAFGLTAGDETPDPVSADMATSLLSAGGMARAAARRIIAFCGRDTGFRDGSLLAPGPMSSGGIPSIDDTMGEDVEQTPTPAEILMDNPVPSVDTTAFDIGDIL